MSPSASTSRSKRPCRAKRMSMWSKNGIFVRTLLWPAPSMLRARRMLVSVVRRSICALRVVMEAQGLTQILRGGLLLLFETQVAANQHEQRERQDATPGHRGKEPLRLLGWRRERRRRRGHLGGRRRRVGDRGGHGGDRCRRG